MLVKDMPLDSLDDGGFEQLKMVLEENPEDCALVFAMLTYEPKGAKWNKAVKLFDKYGFTVKLDKKDLGRPCQNARERGKEARQAV